MKELLITLAYCSIPISLFGMAAFLIYKGTPGWGWFLFVVFCICGSIKWSIK